MKKLIAATMMCAFLMVISTAEGQDRPDPMKPQGENLEVPEGWMVRTDGSENDVVIGSDPESADIYFVNMTPGWHITTGPRAIFWHPANEVKGDYSVSTTLHLFDPEGRNREAYGILFGGENLNEEDQSYLYFVIRNTGDYLIKGRKGDETYIIKEWTPTDNVVIYDDPEESSVKNTLRAEVAGDRMLFYINGEQVWEMEKGDHKTDGLFGLRVNHAMNLHVEDLGMSEQ